MLRMLREVLTDVAGHSQTDIGVDIDLADRELCSVAQLILRNADRVGHVAAIGVDHLYEFLGNGRRTVQNDRESGQSLGDFFQNVEAQGRRNKDAVRVACALLRSELVSAVGSTDGDGQRVAACSGNELFYFFRTCVAGLSGFYYDFVFYAFKSTQLSLYDYAVGVRVLNDLLCQSDVVLERFGGSIDHNGSKSTVNTALAKLEAVTMVQMKRDRDIGILDDCRFNQLYQVSMVCVSTSAFGNLQDNRAVQLAGCLSNTLNDLHVVHVERADGISAVISLLEHFSCCN